MSCISLVPPLAARRSSGLADFASGSPYSSCRGTLRNVRYGTQTAYARPNQICVRKTRSIRRGSIRAEASSSGSVAPANKLDLKGITLYDPSGAPVSLTSLWENRRAVVAFARHFGCILCRKRAALLQSRKRDMDAAGVALVLIAPGSPEQAGTFLEQTNFSGEVYADPDHASYSAFEFVNGANSILNPKSGSRLAQAFMEGYRQDWKLSLYEDTIQRGGWQQGGILVAGPGKDTVHFLFKDKEAGDEPNIEDVIYSCCHGN